MALAQEIETLEIIERAKSGGEIVDWNENPENVKEEAVRRGRKAGLYTRGRTKIMTLPSNRRYRENYVKIFGHS